MPKFDEPQSVPDQIETAQLSPTQAVGDITKAAREQIGEIFEQQLIQLIRAKGIKDPEVRDGLMHWTDLQEAQDEAAKDPLGKIQLNLNRARMYFEAGCREQAIENFMAAGGQAHQEARWDLCDVIDDEMNKKGL